MTSREMEVEDRTEPVLGYEKSSRSITAGAKVSWDLHELSTEISSLSFQARCYVPKFS